VYARVARGGSAVRGSCCNIEVRAKHVINITRRAAVTSRAGHDRANIHVGVAQQARAGVGEQRNSAGSGGAIWKNGWRRTGRGTDYRRESRRHEIIENMNTNMQQNAMTGVATRRSQHHCCADDIITMARVHHHHLSSRKRGRNGVKVRSKETEGVARKEAARERVSGGRSKDIIAR